MFKNILVIDDIKEQAKGLSKGLQKLLGSEYILTYAHEEQDIQNKASNGFYSLVILDLRMDEFDFNGIDIAQEIIANNPFAKIIFVSAFSSEFFSQTKELLASGRILDIQEKSDPAQWYPHLAELIKNYYVDINENLSQINKSLLDTYAKVKNETDSYKKGTDFEDFLSILFGLIGFNSIYKRTKDRTLNEIDLIIRNDISDQFINKFGKYILIECKNYPENNIGKNEFIVFKEKLENTHGLANLGIFATTKAMAKTAYDEALRGSKSQYKIIFLENTHILKLIQSEIKLDCFKKIIDEQVKDN